ncbi:MAG: ABC transporter ATP-binding protein [Bacteriovorax sp.]|nr:ABC transporter ATP-binding protein [Bacteriovorax sp.]
MYKLQPFSYTFNQSGKPQKIFLETPLEFNKNDMIAITGPSGGGKSTFLKVLKGIIPEFSSGVLQGQITFNDLPLTGINFQANLKKILYLFQNPFSQLIYPTTEEEFLFSMENFNFTHEEMNVQKEKFEILFGLKSIWGKKTSQLSNGECQKLVLSSLLAIDPYALLLDEPTAFLDPASRLEFYQFLKIIKGDRLLIIVDHQLDEIRSLVTRIIEVSADGKILELDNYLPKVKKIQTIELPMLANIQNVQMDVMNASFSYHKDSKLLKNISATFKSGDLIAIKGTNGSGKSTLFKLLAGIINPDSGKIITKLRGKEFVNAKNFKNVGFIFQNPENHFFFDTIEEELKQSFKNIDIAVFKDALIERFFNNIDLKKSPFLLSEGEKRRLSILMTIFLGKSIFLYDEPTFGQDVESIEQITGLMRELKRRGFVQIMISHDDSFIKDMASRVLVLEDGSLNEIPRA